MTNLQSPVILFRKNGIASEAEEAAMNKHFVVHTSRMAIVGSDLVLGRYAMLPFYKELEDDVKYVGASLINSYREHRYVADLKNWAYDLEGLTPRTWFRMEDVPDNIGSVVLKGETNSRKNQWRTHMFASNKKEAIEVFGRLLDDSLFATQEIYVREFVPLKTFFVDPINGMPVTEEYRFFVLDGKIMSSGYYWSSQVDQMEKIPSPSVVPQSFLQNVIDRVKDNIRFFVVDVARTASGEWIVIELNDGQMSGLSENDPETLYKNLKYELWGKHYKVTQ